MESIKQKKIETSRKKYGTDFPWQTAEGKLAQKRGVWGKYGVDNVSKSPEIKQKKEETTRTHFGVDNPFQSDIVKEKIKQTNLNKYGVDNPAKRECQRQQMREVVNRHVANSEKGEAPLMYNKKACKIIQQFNDLWGYNFQHAENGGEYHILGTNYYVDGYDKERNIVIEIDEPHHYINGQLKEEDVLRQKEIEEKIGCKFIRLRLF